MTLQTILNKYPKIFSKPNFHDMPEGWLSILDNLCEKLQKIADNGGHQVECFQTKEKYATFRFYTPSHTETQEKLINEAEDEAEKTCQRCGAKNNVEERNDGWLIKLCDKCYTEYLKGYKK